MKRYAINSERILHFLSFMREVPYITSADYRAYFYPSNKLKTYSLDTLRGLCQREYLTKHRLNDGSFIYYLSDKGRIEADGIAEYSPKFSKTLGAIYLRNPPRSPREKPAFIFIPSRKLEFKAFSNSMLSSYQYLHTRGFLEFVYLIRRSNRVIYSPLLDMISGKKSALSIHSNPDILLSNNLSDTENRVIIEFENSKIWEKGLVDKLNNLSRETANYVLFISASDGIFRNIGRIIQRIISGKSKEGGVKKLLSQAAIKSLESRILFGIWRPRHLNNGEVHKLSDIPLYRYNSRIFNEGEWVQKVIDGRLIFDEYGNKVMQYVSPKGGGEVTNFADILGEFQAGFRDFLKGCQVEQATNSLS